jgi:hypothetical protein
MTRSWAIQEFIARLAKLESSVVVNLDVPRVSGIINIETFQFKGLLLFMCKAKNMPHWGAIMTIPLCVPSFLSPDMIPDHQDISHLHLLAMKNATMPSSQPTTAPAPPSEVVTLLNAASSDPTPSDPTLPNPAPLKKYLPVKPHSGQGKEED